VWEPDRGGDPPEIFTPVGVVKAKFLFPYFFRCTKHSRLGAGQNSPRRVVKKMVGDLREHLIKRQENKKHRQLSPDPLKLETRSGPRILDSLISEISATP